MRQVRRAPARGPRASARRGPVAGRRRSTTASGTGWRSVMRSSTSVGSGRLAPVAARMPARPPQARSVRWSASSCAAHRRALVEPVVGRRADQPDEAVPPRAGGGGCRRPRRSSRWPDERRRPARRRGAVEAAHGSALDRPLEQRAVDDEPVDLGVGLDEPQVGVDRRGEQLARGLVARSASAARSWPTSRSATRVADGDVELGPVGEVPVDDGLAGAGLGGDLVHADAGAVLADRAQRGLDELLPAGRAVLVPAGAAVAGGRRRRGSWCRTVPDTFGTSATSWRCPYRHPTRRGRRCTSGSPTAPGRAAVVGGNRIPFARSNGAYAHGVQPGHAHRRARRAGRPLRAGGRAASARSSPAPSSSTAATSTSPASACSARGCRRRPRPTTSSRPAAPASRPRSSSPTRSPSGRSSPASPAASTPPVRRADRGQRGPAPRAARRSTRRRDAAGSRLKALRGLRPGQLVPEIPRNAEPRTGLSMGEHAAHHRAGVGHQPRGAGRARRRQPPQPRRRLRPRLLRRPGHALPRADPRPEPAARLRSSRSSPR